MAITDMQLRLIKPGWGVSLFLLLHIHHQKPTGDLKTSQTTEVNVAKGTDVGILTKS